MAEGCRVYDRIEYAPFLDIMDLEVWETERWIRNFEHTPGQVNDFRANFWDFPPPLGSVTWRFTWRTKWFPGDEELHEIVIETHAFGGPRIPFPNLFYDPEGNPWEGLLRDPNDNQYIECTRRDFHRTYVESREEFLARVGDVGQDTDGLFFWAHPDRGWRPESFCVSVGQTSSMWVTISYEIGESTTELIDVIPKWGEDLCQNMVFQPARRYSTPGIFFDRHQDAPPHNHKPGRFELFSANPARIDEHSAPSPGVETCKRSYAQITLDHRGYGRALFTSCHNTSDFLGNQNHLAVPAINKGGEAIEGSNVSAFVKPGYGCFLGGYRNPDWFEVILQSNQNICLWTPK